MSSDGLRQVCQNAIVLANFLSGGVSELADEHDLGSCAARRGGSSSHLHISGILLLVGGGFGEVQSRHNAI